MSEQVANRPVRVTALESVLNERQAQDAKWGEQNHEPEVWLVILAEEVGELAQAILHTRYGGLHSGCIRTEAVQVAAVALALVECCDRHPDFGKESSS